MRLRKPGRVHGSWRAPRRRFAAAITPSLVSGTPPSSIPCGVSSDLTGPSYPGAAPHSRAICGFIGAHIYNSCLVLVYVVFAWVWVAGLILNIIVVTIFFFANRHEFSWVEGSFTAWYIAFMVWSLILLVVRVYIAGFVHKFFNALQSVGDDRAKELGEHSNYDQKCVVVP
ncbi:unnamed protein product [Pelagomonas calceolata]|uniref:Uncharacterized protein n=1 Tax=Pelagomonas calceolata TaxID=35677 RepID=A0A8J2WWM0_9STRA|nr:unnamed protein product [Pelagomonas calceolata]